MSELRIGFTVISPEAWFQMSDAERRQAHKAIGRSNVRAGVCTHHHTPETVEEYQELLAAKDWREACEIERRYRRQKEINPPNPTTRDDA